MNSIFGMGCLLLGAAVYFFLKYLEVKKDVRENKVEDKQKAKASMTTNIVIMVVVIGLGLFAIVNGVLLGSH